MIHTVALAAWPPPRHSTSGPSGSAEQGIETERGDDALRFADPEGLGHELRVEHTSMTSR